MKRELQQVIDEENFDSIVLYRLPYQSECHIILGSSEKVINGINGLHLTSDGFVFEPFDNSKAHGVFIENIYKASFQELSPLHKKLISALFSEPDKASERFIDDYESYKRHFDKMHQALKNEQLSKVILSRIMKGPEVKQHQIADVFETLTKKYPHAFVYAIYSPHGGTWLGAGPELLLKRNRSNLSTVSLAGTLPNDEHSKWGQKEKNEQQLVTDYIENVLLHHEVDNIEFGPSKTIRAGQVKHLCTTFDFELEAINGNHIGLLYDLHPTPAVCGLPKENAFQMILDTEKHDRQFYAGFLGPVENQRFEFYVNIRCLKVEKGQSLLFIGGGLTIDSDAENEWHETELKAQTLLSVLKNI